MKKFKITRCNKCGEQIDGIGLVLMFVGFIYLLSHFIGILAGTIVGLISLI